MVVVNVFLTDISDTEKAIGAMVKETAESNTVYILNKICPNTTTEAEAKTMIQEEIDNFVFPAPESQSIVL